MYRNVLLSWIESVVTIMAKAARWVAPSSEAWGWFTAPSPSLRDEDATSWWLFGLKNQGPDIFTEAAQKISESSVYVNIAAKGV